MATGAEKVPEAPSLQTRFEQLDNRIEEAHKILDRIAAKEGDEGQPVAAGALGSAVACQSGIGKLIERLDDIAGRVGQL